MFWATIGTLWHSTDAMMDNIITLFLIPLSFMIEKGELPQIYHRRTQTLEIVYGQYHGQSPSIDHPLSR